MMQEKNTYKGNKIYPIEGLSMVSLFEDGRRHEHEFMFWEHDSSCI